MRKRIRNLARYTSDIPQASIIVAGIQNLQSHNNTLRKIGFPVRITSEMSILPSAHFGPVSLYNAEGKELIKRDQPLEEVTRQAEWYWEQWDGPYNTIERSKIVDIPYKRYPRTQLPPPSIEFKIVQKSNSELILVGPPLQNTVSNEKILLHCINLFLEIFGECQLFTKDLETIIKTPTHRLNWEILPKGQMPWEKVMFHMEPLIRQASKGNQPVIKYRLETINKLNPDFRAIGRGGFNGYIVHGFTDKNVFMLESMYYGNATYIFDDTWESLSQKTKAEILNNRLQKERLIHVDGWDDKVKGLLVKKT